MYIFILGDNEACMIDTKERCEELVQECKNRGRNCSMRPLNKQDQTLIDFVSSIQNFT